MSKNYPYKSDTQWWKRPWTSVSGLQRTLLLFVVLPLLLLTALGIRFGLGQASQFQEQRLKNDLELIGRAISIPVGAALGENDQEAIELALGSVFVLGEVYGASVFDVDGTRIAAAGITESDLSRTSIPERIVTTGEGQEAYSRVAGRDLFSHFLPLFDHTGQIKGLIQITRRASDFGRALDQLTIIAWLVWSLLGLTIISAVMLGHYGGVGRHVDKLLAHMQRVAAGDHSHRAAPDGPSEVASLANGLNSMLDSIEQAQRELEAHRQAETALLARLKDNEKMVAIGGMARGIAHELGAPLSVIDGRARRLQKTEGLDARQQRQLEGIRSQVWRLTRTVKQLLDYCRPAATQHRNIAPTLLLEGVAESIRPEVEAADKQMRIELPQHIPSLYADAGRLELALLNLARNALQAARSQISINLTEEPEMLVICIDDDGDGLPEGPVEQLLEPFYTTKSPGEGTGLGLAIVQAIAEEHQGELVLGKSSLGGCRACLRLPIPSAEHTQDTPQPPENLTHVAD
ncbi:sensor histidine kinase [Halopseudomonas pelagia]|uniref:histidine kinase n=1 Tax=Halopseudomonas pelagia TaxID=553151 RepID=A0AA91Z4C4_9GAMM|nr:ATP-binding protein [Halopseudomonas pelagia]PCC97516.1 sensor histidine kinase [Halopseudomonas pelagia]QFY57831.1 HAMP domain-containing protein [Halopseudomonas pelagia]